jgi:hypothetical protein
MLLCKKLNQKSYFIVKVRVRHGICLNWQNSCRCAGLLLALKFKGTVNVDKAVLNLNHFQVTRA